MQRYLFSPLLFSLCLLGTVLAACVQSDAYLDNSAFNADLTTWQITGSTGSWLFDPSNVNQGEQLNNSDMPTYLVTPDPTASAQYVVIKGNIYVNTAGDDDFIGFVLGANDATKEALLISWKQLDQDITACYAYAGLRLGYIHGTYGTDDTAYQCDYWTMGYGWSGSVELLQAGANYGTTGWGDFTTYSFVITYTQQSLKMYINGILELDYTAPPGKPNPIGRLGFFGLSQPNVFYSDIQLYDTLGSVACAEISYQVNFQSPSGCNADLFKLDVDWNDGTPLETYDSPDTSGPTPFFTVSHSYATAGSKLFTVYLRWRNQAAILDSDFSTAVVTTSLSGVLVLTPDPAANCGVAARCDSSNAVLTLPGAVGGFGSPYTAYWSDNPSNVFIINPSLPTVRSVGVGSYFLHIEDSRGICTGDTNTIDVLSSVPVPTLVGTSTCGQIQAGYTGGTCTDGGISYSWLGNGVSAGNTNIQSNLGPGTYSVTLVDGNGCTASTSYDIVDQPPTALCKDPTIDIGALGGSYTVQVSDVNNGSFDPCNLLALSVSNTLLTCSNVGSVVTTTLTASGYAKFSTSYCISSVTVVDATNPLPVCNNLAVYLNANGQGTITADDLTAGSSDTCGVNYSTSSVTSFSCGNLGSPVSATGTVYDYSGNSASCSAFVSVFDTVPPVAICSSINTYLDATGAAVIDAYAMGSSSTDACGIMDIVAPSGQVTCADLYNNFNTPVTRSIEVYDTSNNMDTCSGSVYVYDQVNPTAVCTTTTVYLGATGTATLLPSNFLSSSTDNCLILTFSTSKTLFGCNDRPSMEITGTATDSSGNSNNCVGTVNVIDPIPPTAVCTTGISLELLQNGTVRFPESLLGQASTDNCGIQSYSASPNAAACANVGVVSGVLTVRDTSSNSATCNFQVTVSDLLPPIPQCNFQVIRLNPAGVGNLATSAFTSGSRDNCGIASTTYSRTSFTCADLFANPPVTANFVDVNGNTATCTKQVQVIDITAPSISCQDITVYLGPGGTVQIQPSDIVVSGFDACGIATYSVSRSHFVCSNIGANTVTASARDVSGNVGQCTSIVTVIDNRAPTARCQPTTSALNQFGTATLDPTSALSSSTDNCGIATRIGTPSQFTCSNLGPNTVQYTVTDTSSNSATCSNIVTVVDRLPPVVICSPQTVYLGSNGRGYLDDAAMVIGTYDNCGSYTPSFSILEFTCANIPQQSVQVSARDPSGNVGQCSTYVAVVDRVPPNAVCNAVTVEIEEGGIGLLSPAAVSSGSTDNCGIRSSYLSTSLFNCASVGTVQTVTSTVVDTSSNVATCNAAISIVDNLPPNAECNSISVTLDNSGEAPIPALILSSYSSDNCGISSVTSSTSMMTCDNIGNNQVLITVTDTSGNVDTCTSVVSVNDNIVPQITCEVSATLALNGTGVAPLDSSLFIASLSDNCNIVQQITYPSMLNCSDIGSNVISVTAIDQGGNINSCISSAVIVDDDPPTAVCNTMTIPLDSNGVASITESFNAGSSDNCQIQSLVTSPSEFDCSQIGSLTIQSTLTDPSGNVARCSAPVNIVDSLFPVALCKYQYNLGLVSRSSTVTLTVEEIDAGSWDNCGITNMWLSQYQLSGDEFLNLPISVQLYVEDAQGQVSFCTCRITISGFLVGEEPLPSSRPSPTSLGALLSPEVQSPAPSPPPLVPDVIFVQDNNNDTGDSGDGDDPNRVVLVGSGTDGFNYVTAGIGLLFVGAAGCFAMIIAMVAATKLKSDTEEDKLSAVLDAPGDEDVTLFENEMFVGN